MKSTKPASRRRGRGRGKAMEIQRRNDIILVLDGEKAQAQRCEYGKDEEDDEDRCCRHVEYRLTDDVGDTQNLCRECLIKVLRQCLP